MEAATRRRIERCWAERLGCPEERLREPGFHLLPHPGERIYVVSLGGSELALAPPRLHRELEAASRRGSLLAPGVLDALLPAGARRVGPAFVGYTDREAPAPDGLLRLESARAPELAALRACTPEQEWRHANLDAARPPILAVMSCGEAACAAGAELLQGELAHIGVLTHPALRGRGLARAAVAGATAAALAAGHLPQYQTLLANLPALAVARALGFERFATTLSIHLTA